MVRRLTRAFRNPLRLVATVIFMLVLLCTAPPYITWGAPLDVDLLGEFLARTLSRFLGALLLLAILWWACIAVQATDRRHRVRDETRAWKMARERHAERAFAHGSAHRAGSTSDGFDARLGRSVALTSNARRSSTTVPVGSNYTALTADEMWSAEVRLEAGAELDEGAWRDATAEYEAAGEPATAESIAASSVTGSAASKGSQPPTLVTLAVEPLVAGPGLPVLVTWDFEDADRVSVGAHTGLPPMGSLALEVATSQRIEVVAENRLTRTTAHTALITVLPIPQIELLRIPSPPAVRLSVDVSAIVVARASATTHLDELFSRQDTFRPPYPDPYPPMLVPQRLVTWLRQEREQVPGLPQAQEEAARNPVYPQRRRSARRPEGSPAA